MSRSIRFFEIIQILRQAQNPVTAEALAEDMEVSVRTIYRDIASLQASRLPIDGQAGIGYMLRANFELPPLSFAPEELEAIIVGLSLLGRTRDKGLMRAAQRVSNKISAVLPDGNSLEVPLLTSSWNQIAQSNLPVEDVRLAIRNECKVRIGYRDTNNQLSKRTILPLALIYYIDAIVIAAWCEMRKDFRHFRVDRVTRWEAISENFQKDGEKLRAKWERTV